MTFFMLSQNRLRVEHELVSTVGWSSSLPGASQNSITPKNRISFFSIFLIEVRLLYSFFTTAWKRSQPTSILLCTQGLNDPAKICVCSCFSNSPDVGNINHVASFLSYVQSFMEKNATFTNSLLLARWGWCVSALPNHCLPSFFHLLCSLLSLVPAFGWSGSVLFPKTTGYLYCGTMLCMVLGKQSRGEKQKSGYTWQIWMRFEGLCNLPFSALFD